MICIKFDFFTEMVIDLGVGGLPGCGQTPSDDRSNRHLTRRKSCDRL